MNDQGVVSIRLRPDEREVLAAAAEAEGLSIVQYIRGVAGRAALVAAGGRLTHLPNGAPLAVLTKFS